MKLTGWIISGLLAAFLLLASAAPKLMGMDVASDIMLKLGWSPDYLLLIGVMELLFTLLYLIPRTAVLGAVLMMGLLGGAMATNLRVDMPLFSHTFFSLYLGIFMWAGLWLREPALRKVFPLPLPGPPL